MSTRDLLEIASQPIAGDVVELRERAFVGSTDECEVENILRVIAVAEELVWFREYGKGRRNIVTINAWGKRITDAISGTFFCGGVEREPKL